HRISFGLQSEPNKAARVRLGQCLNTRPQPQPKSKMLPKARTSMPASVIVSQMPSAASLPPSTYQRASAEPVTSTIRRAGGSEKPSGQTAECLRKPKVLVHSRRRKTGHASPRPENIFLTRDF